MKIYINGCECGMTGVYVRRLKKQAKENGTKVEVKNSKYSAQVRKEHIESLRLGRIPSSGYPDIVVRNNKIVRLREWPF